MITSIILAGLFVFLAGNEIKAQLMLPSLNDARSGFWRPLKFPGTKDFQKFQRQYEKHLKHLNKRSEKAYRKSFLQFVDIEDELLLSLCDQNEFRANMLMKTSMASFGKLEADRQRWSNERQYPQSNCAKRLKAYGELCYAETESDTVDSRTEQNEVGEQPAHASKLYADYMSKRLTVYRTVFRDGSVKQRKLLEKLELKAKLWSEFKEEDEKLNVDFEKKNEAIARYKRHLSQSSPELPTIDTKFKGTHVDPSINPESFPEVNSIKENLTAMAGERGLLEEFTGAVGNDGLTGLLGSILTNKQSLDSLSDHSINDAMPHEEYETGDNGLAAVPLKNRLYFGFDFQWVRESNYYPQGLGGMLTAGYRLNPNSGIALELGSSINGARVGLTGDERFSDELISHITVGANVDYRLWRWVNAGIGLEGIHNKLEAPSNQFFEADRWSRNAVGVPAILRILVPAGKGNSTAIEIRYDLIHNNNIKPALDFRIGYLIGRR